MSERVPSVVVSGFLGSGKTTLVRHVLASAQREGVRMAVVSNELGEIGIDRALLGTGEEAYVELAGGCVCCKLGDELLETLQLLYERVRPERVIVETSGVALPYDTLINFWREPVCRWSTDEIGVVVVNAEQVCEGRDLDGTFADQLASADLIVLNKIDLVAASDLPAIEDALAAIEPDAPIVRCVRGAVDPALLFPPEPPARDGTSRRERGSAPARSHDHLHRAFVQDVVELEAGIDESALRRRLEELGALRVKGFVRTSAGLRVVQGVGRRIELERPTTEPPASLVGRVVVIRRTPASPVP